LRSFVASAFAALGGHALLRMTSSRKPWLKFEFCRDRKEARK
jgi:hypothetical protein